MNTDMCLLPLTLCSRTIEGAEQWESYKALRKAMKTGKAADVRAAGAAIMQEMFLGDSEAERGFQPSDELIRVVQWMQMY